MSQFAIYEDNIEKLEKKLEIIKKKCEKYSCSFHYEKLGEEFRNVTDDNGETFTARFVIVEVSGTAICESGWRVVAVIEHEPALNIIHLIDNSFKCKVPEEYYYSEPICQHCNTKRRRKSTVLIYHEGRHEYKQVGKSCLLDYTGGLDADLVSYMYQYIETVKEFSQYSHYSKKLPYYLVEDVLKYASYDVLDRDGYYAYDPYEYEMSTRESVLMRISKDFMIPEEYREFVESEVHESLQYIRNLDVTGSDEYLHNLKSVCLGEYVSKKYVGILVSLIPTYHRYLKSLEEAERYKIEEEYQNSEYSGEIGDKLEIEVFLCYEVCSWENQYGYTYLYKILGEDGNVYVWYSSKFFGENPEWKVIKGTVKDHKEYKGIKQTILTRCKGV